ncbi:MAG: S1/P1 nuclease [Desulfobacteria bacterium]
MPGFALVTDCLKRRASLLLFLCSFVLLTAQGLAWGPAGHRWITNRAMDNLEGRFQELFTKHRSTVVQQTMGPDYRKDQDPEEPSRHFIDLELYGEFPFPDIDLNYDGLVGRLGKETVEKNGTILWAGQRTFEKLVEAFHLQNLEQILLYSADLSHYVGDLHQPFHTTENFDGQLTGQLGIHSRFESDLVNLYLEQVSLSKAAPHNLGPVLPKLQDMAVESYQWVDSILLADRRVVSELKIDRKQYLGKTNEGKKYPDQYFRRMFEEVGGVLGNRLNQAAYRVASLWWMAWEKAGQPDF